MELKQYYLGCLAHASYLIADETSREAAIVDPQRDVDQYLADAADRGYRIKYVVLTHFHADFVAGHIELRDRTGAEIVLGSRAQADFPFLPAHDGQTLRLGEVRLEVMETPGHTPEGISMLVYDPAKSPEDPYAVLTGDTLFIGDVGRPDLLASIGVTADELADMLYASVGRLRDLPDATLVYPAHGAGSMCGKNLSRETVSTIGEQKRINYALQPMSAEQFRDMVTVDQPEAPDYFVYDAIKNRQELQGLEASLERALRPLSVDDALAAMEAGAQTLDVREAADFERGSLRGAINVGLGGKYATWCGTVLRHDAPIVVIAEPGEEEEAIMRLGRIGFDNAIGYLGQGVEALRDRPELLAEFPRLTAVEVQAMRDGGVPFTLLDVRTLKEREAGLIEGSVSAPLNRLAKEIDAAPRELPIVVHCEGGYRSAIACSLLARAGYADVSDMIGGFKAWTASGLPASTTGDAAACGS
ncbi:MAG: MBL fold metallo-hydrolase [Planctomycetales bacterium]|nr:MBL fold metallo-hydrolase [Planctomycetales bacterium]